MLVFNLFVLVIAILVLVYSTAITNAIKDAIASRVTAEELLESGKLSVFQYNLLSQFIWQAEKDGTDIMSVICDWQVRGKRVYFYNGVELYCPFFGKDFKSIQTMLSKIEKSYCFTVFANKHSDNDKMFIVNKLVSSDTMLELNDSMADFIIEMEIKMQADKAGNSRFTAIINCFKGVRTC